MHSLYNPLWVSNLAYPDYDMFHSAERHGRISAMSRAISGGPIYLTDFPDRIDHELVMELCFSDGRILRPDVPALPTRDSLFIDPIKEPLLLKSATVSRGVGVIGLFNLHEKPLRIIGSLSAEDLILSVGPADTYYLYFYSSKEGKAIAPQERIECELEELEGEIALLSPVRDGIAIVGLTNKMISPAAVTLQRRNGDTLEIDLYENGPFLAYLEENETPLAVWINGERVTLSNRDLAPYSFVNGQLRLDTRHRTSGLEKPRIRIILR
jgi:hypothetical protein